MDELSEKDERQKDDAVEPEMEDQEESADEIPDEDQEIPESDENSEKEAKAEEEHIKTWRERYLGYYLAWRSSGLAFKIGMSLLTGIFAAIIIVIAGVTSERLLFVIFLRAIVGFFAATAIMLFVSLWLEKIGIPLYVSRHEELQEAWTREAEEPDEPPPSDLEEALDESDENSQAESPNTGEPDGSPGNNQQEEQEEPPGFSPMTAENLKRVR